MNRFKYNLVDGAIPKWSKGTVCKTVIRGFESRSHLHFEIAYIRGPMSNKNLWLALLLSAAVAAARPALAQDDAADKPAEKAEQTVEASAKMEPAKAAPAKAAEKPAEKAEATKANESDAAPTKPAPKPAPKKEPSPAKEAAPAKKELSAGAKALTPLAESYKKAYDELQKWIEQIDQQTADVNARIAKAQDEIEKNEGAITKAKLSGDDKTGRELAKANKQLWTDLAAAKKERSTLFKGFGVEAGQKVKGYSADAAEKLQQAKSELK